MAAAHDAVEERATARNHPPLVRVVQYRHKILSV